VEIGLKDKMNSEKVVCDALHGFPLLIHRFRYAIKLIMKTKGELENPDYEKASFGMITFGACSLIRRTYRVWTALLNREMQKHGYVCFSFLFRCYA
jgi:hypothetical protein